MSNLHQASRITNNHHLKQNIPKAPSSLLLQSMLSLKEMYHKSKFTSDSQSPFILGEVGEKKVKATSLLLNMQI